MLFNETKAFFVCSNGKKNLILQQIYSFVRVRVCFRRTKVSKLHTAD